MEKEEKIICYYHSDMDGIASAAILKKVYPKAKLIKVQYGEEHSFETGYDKCFVVDFSFDKVEMEMLIKNHKSFCWIDHHKSAMEKLPELWKSDMIEGFRRLDLSGCELTWEWFFPNKTIPKAIRLIGDWDMWKFAYGTETKEFHEYAYLILDSPDNPNWVWFTEKDNQNTDLERREACQKGRILLEAKQKRVEKAFNEGIEIEYLANKCRLCNSNHDISDLGNYCCREQGYDIGIIWSMKGNNCIVSLRSVEADVSLIAKQFGGGGHKNAAGFTLNSFEDLKHILVIK